MADFGVFDWLNVFRVHQSLDSYLACDAMILEPPTQKLFLFVLLNLMLRKNYRKVDSRLSIPDITLVVLRNS